MSRSSLACSCVAPRATSLRVFWRALACVLAVGVLAGCAPSRQIVALDGLRGRPASPVASDACQPDSFPADRVYFDTDKSVLRPEAQRTLTAQADWLRACLATRLRIEGNADERGTRDYNLALGERRALAVKAFLVERGVVASRIETVSYGKDRPIGSNYAINRNVNLVLTSGVKLSGSGASARQ